METITPWRENQTTKKYNHQRVKKGLTNNLNSGLKNEIATETDKHIITRLQ